MSVYLINMYDFLCKLYNVGYTSTFRHLRSAMLIRTTTRCHHVRVGGLWQRRLWIRYLQRRTGNTWIVWGSQMSAGCHMRSTHLCRTFIWFCASKKIVLNQLYERGRISNWLGLNLWLCDTGKELWHSWTWIILQSYSPWLFSHNWFFNKFNMRMPYNRKTRRCLGRSRFFWWSCCHFQVLQNFFDSLCVTPPTSGINLQINVDQITCSRSSLHTREQNNNYPVQKKNECKITKYKHKESMNQAEKL